jgi:type III restriction enzyme
VFQICVLRNMGTERWRRQSIGRGLRLCVDGSGNRVHGFDINRLTVIANESYEEFADRLQREMADDLGITFGMVAEEALAALTYKDASGSVIPVSMTTARTLFQALMLNGYIDGKGKVQEPLRAAVQDDNPELARLIEQTLGVPEAVAAILGYIKRLARPVNIKKSSERVQVPVVEENLTSPEFGELWECLRHRSEYRVEVEEDALRAELVAALRSVKVPARRAEWTTRIVTGIDQKGLTADVEAVRRVDVTYADSEELPDILSVLADRTQLTRATLAHVLTHSRTLELFKANPQAYIDKAAHALNDAKRNFLVDGLRYQLVDANRPDTDRRYELSLFREADLSGYTGTGGKIICDAEGRPRSFAARSVYEYVLFDSTLERDVALDLLHRDGVLKFVKLPPAFTIPTPLGTYNPDWAVLVTDPGGGRRVVLETKAHSQPGLLRPEEEGKTKAARVHFDMIINTLAIDVTYEVVEDIDEAIAVLESRLVV